MCPCLYLIRHGETEWSLAGRHTGITDVPLTARGEIEARKFGRHYSKLSLDQVLTSPKVRARRTCELAAFRPAAVIEPELTEWNYGDYEGRTTAEIRLERPDWNIFRDGCPRGETPLEISGRADRLLARLRELKGNIALFSHGHFGRVLGARWIGLDAGQARHLQLNTSSLSILGYEHDRADQPVIALWNSTSRETGAASSVTDAGHNMKQQAIDGWENEGGEIPHGQIRIAGPAGRKVRSQDRGKQS